jgi:hypothetical protein
MIDLPGRFEYKSHQRVAVAFDWASHSRLMAYGFVPCVQVSSWMLASSCYKQRAEPWWWAEEIAADGVWQYVNGTCWTTEHDTGCACVCKHRAEPHYTVTCSA